MKNLTFLALFTLLFVTLAANAQCGPNCYFYGGDLDLNNPNTDGLANGSDASVPGTSLLIPPGLPPIRIS